MNWLFTIVFTIIVCYLCYWWFSIYVPKSKLHWMPGEIGLPVFGIALEFKDNTEIINKFEKYLEKHNGLCWIKVLTLTEILATDYKFIEFILSSTQFLDKGNIYGYLSNWLGTGLVTSAGSKWKKMRKILTPTFHFSILESFLPIFESNSEMLVDLLKNESLKNKGLVNVQPFVTLCALDIICESAMGVKIDAQVNTNSDYVIATKGMCELVVERVKSVTNKFDLLYLLTPSYYKERNFTKILQNFTSKVIHSRRRELETEIVEEEVDDLGRKKKMAFLDLLLKCNIDGQPLPDDYIKDEVNTFMFAGHDTTSSTISSVIYTLAKYPDIQEKAMQEQKLIFADDMNRQLTSRDLQEMKYLENVIKETLRLYPSIPFVSRHCTKDTQYEKGKIIPAGVDILIFIHGINRNPNVFPEPEKFDPDRFNSITGMSPYAYVPFSAGPRNCIGQKFALLEVKAVVSKLLRNFQIMWPGPRYEPLYTSELVYYSKNGIHVVLKERE